MARNFFTFVYEVTPSANPETLIQLVAADEVRMVLSAIELQPMGATGATAPLQFDLTKQTGAGGLTADGTGFIKVEPASSETIQGSVRTVASASEPTPVEVKRSLSLHQQGSRSYLPLDGEIIIPGGQRLGLRYVHAVFVKCKFTLHLEE